MKTRSTATKTLSAAGSGELDPTPPGTDFQRRVWRELLKIPRGQTRTYGEIARAIGQPRAARAVGQAVGANPLPVVVPCHRVLAAGGRLGGYAWGPAKKRALLAAEGVTVRG